MTYTEMATLASSGGVSDSAHEANPVPTEWEVGPISKEKAPEFLGKLLQYYILQCIDSLQRNSVTTYLGGAPPTASAGIEPPDSRPYSYKALFKELSGNRFFRPFLHR